jgi:hypothetical protein
LPRLRSGLQPLRLDDREAEAVLTLHRHVPRRDPDPHAEQLRERHPVMPASVVRIEVLLHGNGRGEGAGCAREDGHHTVTGVLDDPAATCHDCRAYQPVVPLSDALGLLLAQADPHAGRVDEVGEHHGQRLDSGRAVTRPAHGAWIWAIE